MNITGWGWAPTPFGHAWLAWQQQRLCLLEFADTTPQPALDAALRHDALAQQWAQRVFDSDRGRQTMVSSDVLWHGTAFQQAVWQALMDIPAGTTVSYQELATRIGKPTAARAVGLAVGANTLAVVVPCHRVVRSNGGLGGYKWGLQRKQALLKSEGCLL